MRGEDQQLESHVFAEKLGRLRLELQRELEELELELKQSRYARKRAYTIWLAAKPRRRNGAAPVPMSAVLWASGPFQTYLQFAAAVAYMRSFMAMQRTYDNELEDEEDGMSIGLLPVPFPPGPGFLSM